MGADMKVHGDRDSSERSALERVRRAYAEVAERYDRSIRLPEKLLFQGGRAWTAARAVGRTLEIGLGTGRNLEHYPPGIHLVGIDVSAEMLAIARRRARGLKCPVDLLLADAAVLPFADATFDTVVSTLTLCTIPDYERAVLEAARVLRPGGRMVLLEHVRSTRLAVRGVQRILDPLARWLACDHLLREPLDSLVAAGLEIAELERAKWGIVERVVARRPERSQCQRQ